MFVNCDIRGTGDRRKASNATRGIVSSDTQPIGSSAMATPHVNTKANISLILVCDAICRDFRTSRVKLLMSRAYVPANRQKTAFS